MKLHLKDTMALMATTLAAASPLLTAAPYFDGGVPNANPRIDLVTQPNLLADGLQLREIARGSNVLENPSGLLTTFGFLDDNAPPFLEPTKTEPDENTYLLLLRNPGGPTPGYNYGHRFLFQGHENAGNKAYITRINLDVQDPAHRITLLTPVGSNGLTGFNSIDGSTWNPFTETLLFTQEAGTNGGVIELSPFWNGTTPPPARTLHGILGRGGYEGIHPDDRGNLLIIEDTGGTSVNVDPNDTNSIKRARLPNSFVYRFVPKNPFDLSAGGKLQALQVSINGRPVKFVPISSNAPFGDVFSNNQLLLHTKGASWPVQWVTIHDTAVDGTASFDANAAAKAAGATPFKRPENAQFQPGSDFRTFFFDVTGDTDTNSAAQPALAARGAWGAIFRVDLVFTRNTGKISLVVLGDADHAAFDNLAFAEEGLLLAGEDRGDTLHAQLNKLDSIWAFDVKKPFRAPVRVVALGRDDLSTIDAHLQAFPPAPPAVFQNDGDNETTGIHVSNGLPGFLGMMGTKLNLEHARAFCTQQHGENVVWEILGENDGDHDVDDIGEKN